MSGATLASSQNPALKPSTRSSKPRKPKRLELKPSEPTPLKVVALPFLIATTFASTIANNVALDCACEVRAAQASRQASAIRVFLASGAAPAGAFAPTKATV